MNLIDRPTITLIAHSVPTGDAVLLVPPHEYELEIIASVGAKSCYNAHGVDGNPVQNNIRKAVSNEHYSVLEHSVLSYLITGISRGLSHELVRHRHLSFSQRSTRYVEEGEEPRVVLEPRALALRDMAFAATDENFDNPNISPEALKRRNAMIAWEKYLRTLDYAFHGYNQAVETFTEMAPMDLSGTERRKWARGAARQLLPHALETQMVVTGNLRTWREVLLLRSGRGAEAEARRWAHYMWADIKERAPNAFHDFVEERVYEGFVVLERE